MYITRNKIGILQTFFGSDIFLDWAESKEVGIFSNGMVTSTMEISNSRMSTISGRRHPGIFWSTRMVQWFPERARRLSGQTEKLLRHFGKMVDRRSDDSCTIQWPARIKLERTVSKIHFQIKKTTRIHNIQQCRNMHNNVVNPGGEYNNSTRENRKSAWIGDKKYRY